MQSRYLLLVAVLCLLCAAVIAAEPPHSSITGIITGPDGARLPGVNVSARLSGADSAIRAISSSSGTYRMPDLPAGSYEIIAELTGFETYAVPELRIDAGTSKVMDFSLKIATILETVTVVSSLRKDSIEATENRESTARDAGEAMAGEPGVWKLRKGGIASDLVLRGFASKDLNVLVDGQRIYGACPNHMDPPAFHVDFAEVDRIEIGKGPVDVKNQGSLGGVVNIVTRKAEPGFHASGNLSTGSYGFVNPSTTLSYGQRVFSILGGYSYRFSSPFTDGSGKRFTDYLNYRPNVQDSDAFRIGTVWGKISFKPAPGHLAQISYTRQESDHVLYPYLQMDAIYDDTDRFSAGYQVNDLPGSVRSIRVMGYLSKVNHWMTDEFRTSSLNLSREYSMGTLAGTRVIGGKVELILNKVLIGVEAFHREWNGATQLAGAGYAPQFSIPDVRTDNVGLYSEYSKPITDRLRLSLSGRLDTLTTAADALKANTNLYFAYNSTRMTSRTNNFPSGNVRLSYRTPVGIEISGGVGHAVRVPDARERYFALKRMGTDWVGNPDLKPSRNTGLDSGISFRRRSLLLESSVYLNFIDDYISVVPQAKVNMVAGVMNPKARSYQNVNARMYGGEFLLSYLFTRRLFLSSDFSYVRGVRDMNPAKGILTTDLAEIPPMRSRTSLRYDMGWLFGEAEGLFSGAQRRVDSVLGEQATPGYGIANIKAGVNYRRMSIKLGLNNILGRQYFEHLSYQRDPFRSGARVYEPGRNLLVNISYRY